MIGVPPGCTIGVKPAQIRDHPKKPKKDKPHRFVGHDLELTEAEMKGKVKIAWADKVADSPNGAAK